MIQKWENLFIWENYIDRLYHENEVADVSVAG